MVFPITTPVEQSGHLRLYSKKLGTRSRLHAELEAFAALVAHCFEMKRDDAQVSLRAPLSAGHFAKRAL